MSFASPERLLKYLGVIPGSVTPLGLINDTEKAVEFFIHRTVLDADEVSIHPNVNTASVIIKKEDFAKLLASFDRPIAMLE